MTLLTLFHEIRDTYTAFSENESFVIALLCRSYSPDTTASLQLLEEAYNHSPSFEELKIQLWPAVFEKFMQRLKPERKTIGIWANDRFGESQFSDLALALHYHDNYNFTTILSQQYLDTCENITREHICEKLSLYDSLDLIFVPVNTLLKTWEFLDVIFATERRGGEKTYFPRKTKRVVQAHGLDNSFAATVIEYSGGSSYDYVLTPHPLENDHPVVSSDVYFNLFPRDLIEHSSTEVCAIPSGYPKVDRFMKKLAEMGEFTPDSLIYNFSLWGHEDAEARNALEPTLELLLNEFSEYNVVFRPYPNDIDLPEIQHVIQRFSSNERFVLSTSNDYVNDYLTGALIISHRGSSSQVFTYATLRPTVRYLPNNSNRMEFETWELGYGCRNEKNFINTIKHILANPDCEKARLLEERNKRLANPGFSTEYVVENLPYIIDGRRNSEWNYHPLFDPEESQIAERDDYIRTCEKICKTNCTNLTVVNTGVEKFPDDPLFLFYKAVIYQLHAPTFIYQWSVALECILKALQIAYTKRKAHEETYQRAIDWFHKNGVTVILTLRNHYHKHGLTNELTQLQKKIKSFIALPELCFSLFTLIEQQQRKITEGEQKFAQFNTYISTNNQNGIAHIEKNELAQAIQCLQRNLDILPNEKDTLFNISMAYGQGGDLRNGLIHITKLLVQEPEQPDGWQLWYTMINALGDSNTVKEYTSIILRHFQRFPQNDQILFQLCTLCITYRLSEFALRLLPSVNESVNDEVKGFIPLLQAL